MSRYLPLLSAIAAISCLCQPSTAIAFHERGVANCDGCHVMHDSQDGFPLGFGDVGALLKGPSASDVCLSCHATELGAVLADDPLFPSPEMGGGNFVFLFEDNLNDGPEGATNPIPGEAAGHSIVAPGYGLATDSRHPLSPGGSFPASELGCTSCHDPHGNA
ncbi:MAG: hypothetical protein GY769_15800, partial [bacterium]|nr:hypothetical protein [bacterium]